MAEQGREPGGFDMRWFLGLVRRQAKLILATVFIVCSITALVLFQLTPIYSGSALIIVDPRQQSILDPEAQMALAPSDQGRVESEVEILRAPSVFLKVIRELELYNDPEFGPSPGWRDRLMATLGFQAAEPTPDEVLKQTLEALQKATSISRVGITYLIEVTVRSKDPDKAAHIANALAAAYVAEQVNSKTAMVLGIQQALLSRLTEASAALRASEQKLDQFIVDHVDSVADDASRENLSSLRNIIATRTAETSRLSNVLAASQASLDQRDWDSLVEEINSNQLRTLVEQRNEIASALTPGLDEAKAVDLRASLQALDAQLETAAKDAISGVRTTLDQSQKEADDLRQQLRDSVIGSELPNDVLVKLYEIQQEAAVGRQVYQDLLNRSKVIESQKNVQVPDSRIVSEAYPPTQPSFPKKRISLLIAGVMSLGLGLGIAFLRENFVGGFVTEVQAEEVLGVPVVSSLPRLPGGAGPLDVVDRANELVEHPLSAYSEAVRRTRLALELGGRRPGLDADPKTIMVTSTIPGEGKTQTTVSIARSFAIAGRRTLLIDCDLRRPSVHKALGLDLTRGVSDFLGGGDDTVPESILVTDEVTGLSVILGARGARSTTDFLFEQRRFGDLISWARANFDCIILDSSPVLPVVDPRILLRYADAVVVVIRWAATPQREVGAAISDLKRVNARNVKISAVLNATVGGGGYGGSGYYAYGNYHDGAG